MGTHDICHPRETKYVGDSLIQSMYVLEPTNDRAIRVTISPPIALDVTFGGLFTQLVGLADDASATFSCRVMKLQRVGTSTRAELSISRTDGKHGWSRPLSLFVLWTMIQLQQGEMPLLPFIE